MRQEELLDHLVDLAHRLAFEVRYEHGSFRDGFCRVQNKRIIVLNRTSPISNKIAALSKALSHQSLEGIFLLPVVRKVITQASRSESKPELENHYG